MNLKHKKGFTLIELLVVISIISLLSSIVMTTLNGAKSKALDARRKSDLNEIRMALELYHDTCGTYVIAQNCTGTSYGSNGWGWFNYASYAGSVGSVGQGLVYNGFTKTEMIDPSGQIAGPLAYMIGATQDYFTVWATITNPSAADTNTLNNCYFPGNLGYGNYYGAGTQNYCVSNK